MFFRRRPPPSGRSERWRALADRLELVDASDHAERIRRWLDLDVDALEPAYALRRSGVPTVYLFDTLRERRGPSGVARSLHRHALVRGGDEVSRVAFRALPRQDKVLESLQASRSGAERVALRSAPEFDARVSLYARAPDALAALMTAPVRRALERLLVDRGAPSVSLVVGERHVLVRFATDDDDDLVRLELLLADTLSLVSLLPAVQRAHDDVSPDDLLDLP